MSGPHVLQRHALHAMHQDLAERGVVVLPCGGGKTRLGRWYAEQTGARLTVVFVPTLALVPQTVLAYRYGADWRHNTMIVCSDESTGRAVRIDDLVLPAWARVAVTASTSPRAVEAFLARGGEARLIVSTYHSAPRVAAALQQSGTVADLVICDESHRLTGRPRREYRTVLDDTALPARQRLFLTATPVEAAAWAAELDESEDVAAPLAMDDENTFGPTIYRATFGDAVAAGVLVDYDVEVLCVPREGAGDAAGRVDAGVAAVLAALRDGSRRVLTFHSRVAHARNLAQALHGFRIPDGPTIHAEHVEARHRAGRRGEALARLADPAPGTATVLASARVLSEGLDVPAVDTVVFAEPRTSPVDIVQAVGRVMRTAPGKTRGRIVLAVPVEGSLDEDTELGATRWRHVWAVLRALASMDERFAARLQQRLTPGNPRKTPRTDAGPGLQLDLPAGLDVEQFVLRCLDRSGGGWWARYDLLAAYTREHGHARPGHVVRGGVDLGSWVTRQRTAHHNDALEQTRVDALAQLPGWAWDAREIAWWRAAAVWQRHIVGSVSEFDRWAWLAELPGWSGSAPPARRFASLAEFAADTCARRRRGGLPAHLERAAADLPTWTWDTIPADDARMVEALDEYGEWEKHLNPPHDYINDNRLPLGAWVTAIRRRHHTGKLHPALEIELQLLAHGGATPLLWESGSTAWRLGYLALSQFVARERTSRIPYEHVEVLPDCEVRLSRWCVVQRREHRLGRLTADRVTALARVPGWQWEIAIRPDQEQRPVLPDVEHGERWAYARGCRCDPCTDVNSAYERARQAGDIDCELVDAQPAREHLRILLARGAQQKALARAAGVNVKSIVAIAGGEVARIRPEREALILALTATAAAEQVAAGRWGETVDAAPTWRLIDWMVLRGWPKSWIARELGQGSGALQLHRKQISKDNADKVADLDRRLGRTRRPPRRGSNRSGTRATLPTLEELLKPDVGASA